MSDNFIPRDQAEGDLLACAAFIAERIRSADGRAESMKAIVPMYLERGEVDLAAELANTVDDPYSRDKLLTLVAEKCAEIDDDEYAIQLADAIEDQGLGAQALERIALVLAANGKTDRATEIADSMGHPDFVYSGVAVRQALDGDEEASRATLEQIDFPTAKVSALQHIASSFVEAGRTEEAAAKLELAVEAAKEIEHDEERLRAVCDIGTQFTAAGRNDKAIETFDDGRAMAEALDNVHRDFFLGSCALGFLQAGSSDLADRTLDLVMDKTQMASALLGFARQTWKLGDKEDAVDTLEEAYAILKSQRESETRDSRARNTLVASFAMQFAGFGKTERALEIARENPDPEQQIAALAQIAQILTVQNEDVLAAETINEIDDDAGRLYALIGVADEKLKLGERDASVALLEEAAALAEAVPQFAARSGVFNELILRFADQSQPERARELAHENLLVISQIRDESSLSASLASLAAVFDATEFDLNEQETVQLRTMMRKSEI